MSEAEDRHSGPFLDGFGEVEFQVDLVWSEPTTVYARRILHK